MADEKTRPKSGGKQRDWRSSLAEPASGIVLAGGKSSRMGTSKTSLVVRGSSLLRLVVDQIRPHVREVIVGGTDVCEGDAPGCRIVPDRSPGEGPLMGIVSCMSASTSDRFLVAACDLPEIPGALVERMLDEALRHDGVVPRLADGRLEPLLAVYRRRLLPDAERLLLAGVRSIRPLYEGRDIKFLDLDELGLAGIPNLNTPEEVEEYESLCRQRIVNHAWVEDRKGR